MLQNTVVRPPRAADRLRERQAGMDPGMGPAPQRPALPQAATNPLSAVTGGREMNDAAPVQPKTLPQTAGQGGQTATDVATAPNPDPLPMGPLFQQFGNFASGVMSNPSRFDNDMVRQTMDQINTETDRARKEALQGMDEHFASRGLIGSSPEVFDPQTGRVALEGRLDENRGRRLNELLFQQASTLAGDRAMAAGIGGQAAGMEMSRERMESDDWFRERQAQLRALGMDRDEAYRAAQTEWQNQFAERELEARLAQMDDQQRRETINLLLQAGSMGLLDPGGGGGGLNLGGAGMGALSGAGTGAMIGSVIPGIGTAIGAGAGGLIGGLSGLFG